MKAFLINMHLLVPKSRSSAKVKVKFKGYISQKMAVSGAFMFHKHILFIDTVKPVLEMTCIKRPPALREHCSNTATLLKSTL